MPRDGGGRHDVSLELHDPPRQAWTSQAYTRSLEPCANDSGLVRVLGGLVETPVRFAWGSEAWVSHGLALGAGV